MSSDDPSKHPPVRRWEELGDEFHMMIGYCIAAWADVEDILFRIFSDCIGPRYQSAIIYYKTPGLEARFSLTDEIVRSVLPQMKKKPGQHDHAHVVAWNKARKGYGDLLAIRRRIAHHPVTIRMELPRAGFNTEMFGQAKIGAFPSRMPSAFEIYMSEHEKLRGRQSDIPALRLADLQKHLLEVGALGDRLLRFLIDVLSKPAAKPSSPSPLPHKS